MAKHIGQRIKYWAQVLMIPVYGLSCLMPRSKRIWAFGSTFGRRFADSPRYFYLFLSEHYQDQIRPIWFTDNVQVYETLKQNGYCVYMRKSLKGIWYRLRAKVYCYDNYPKDISHWLSGRALKINLWHGVPLKKIQRDNEFDAIRHPKNAWERWKSFPRHLSDEKKTHYILATSEFYRPIFESAFGTTRSIVNGYPRTDIFESHMKNVLLSDEKQSLEEIAAKKKDKRVLLYMPTFRESETEFFNVMDLNRLNAFLEKEKLLLCVKLHCKSKLMEPFKAIAGEHIVVVNPAADPYVFVPGADLLITDYSSIYFDYLLCCKPIVFFCYDLDTYLNDSRKMYFEYDEFTPGERAVDQEKLESAISHALEVDGYAEERLDLKEKVFVDEKGINSELLYDKINVLLRK